MKRASSLASFTLLSCIACTSTLAAGNPLGLYVGAGIGKANTQYGFFDEGAGGPRNFDGNQFGWNAVLGVRPIRWVGAELEYLDFGNARLGARPSVVDQYGMSEGLGDFYGANGHARAAAVFAVGYLPLPLPGIDVFGKFGEAHVWAPYSFTGDYPDTFLNCSTTCVPMGQLSVSQSNTATRLAYGGGAQVRFGAFSVRAEYERISYSTGDPNLLSLGVTWTF